MSKAFFLSMLLLACAPAAAAQDKLTPKTVARIVHEANRIITNNYVHPEKAKMITSRLSRSLASGRYAAANPQRLADIMTQDLLATSNDKHMWIRFDPAEAKAQKAGPMNGSIRPYSDLIPITNHGINEFKVLPGNVRYMNIALWLWDPEHSPQVYDDAMRFLRAGDAYVVDLRNNPGGEDDAVTYFISHFIEPGTKMSIFRSGPTKIEESFATKVGGERLPPRPLFLLVSSNSASASEAAATHVKNFKLGKLIGETTAGAGNSNDIFPIEPGFVLSVSTDTAVHAVTNTGWEGTGVVPDIAVEPSAALDRAHLEALTTIQQSVALSRKGQIAWNIQALEGKLNPPAVSAENLKELAGRYEGPRVVSERGGKLYYRRTDGSEVELIPLGPDLFGQGTHTASYRIKFTRRDGAVTGATILTAVGPEEQIAREGS